MHRSVPLLLLCAPLVLSGCRAASQLRVGRGIDHDFAEEGDQGELGEEPDSGPAAPRTKPSEPVVAAPPETNRGASSGQAAPPPESESTVTPTRVAMLRGRRLTIEGGQGPASWSADGSRVLFQARRDGVSGGNPWPQTWLMDADGDEQRRITMGIGTTERGAFVPGREETVSYASTHHTGKTPPPNSPGTEVALRQDLDVYVQNLTTGGFVALTDTPGYDGDASWCGDGSRLAFVSDREGDPEIYTMAADGTDLRRVTHRPGIDRAPAVSPDCSRIAWVAEGGRGSALMVAAIDGAGAGAVLGAFASHDGPAWMPHGEVLLFSSSMASDDDTHDLFALALQGGAIKRLTASTGNERSPAPSPDGARVLYTADRTGRAQLFVAELEPGIGEHWTRP